MASILGCFSCIVYVASSAILHRRRIIKYINKRAELFSHKPLFTKQIVSQS